MNWYTYMGGDPLAPASYRKTKYDDTGTPPNRPSCTSGCKICAILLSDSTYYPTTPFTAALINQIIDALADGKQSPSLEAPIILLKSC